MLIQVPMHYYVDKHNFIGEYSQKTLSKLNMYLGLDLKDHLY